MKREIKFRAWDKALKEILPNVQNHINDKEWAFGSMLKNDRWVLMQFTGLHDKNGREIYEGDILESDSFVDTFSWTDGGYTFDRDTKDEVMTVHYPYEVIGNIYSNPELLTPLP